MLTFFGLRDEVRDNPSALAAMSLIGQALERRSPDEQEAFWRAIELYYVSREAPGEEAAAAPDLARTPSAGAARRSIASACRRGEDGP